MIISSALTNNGTSFTASPASSLTTGRVTVGTSAAQQSFATADIGYAISARLTTSSTTATLDVQTGVCTGSAAFVAGVAQVETATVIAAAGATSSGNCIVTVTGSTLTGSPLAVTIPLTTSANTAILVASALASGLNANAAIAAKYSVASSGADIVLTVKADANGNYLANDGTLNIAIPSGLGITAASTSTDTTAGVASSGVQVLDGDGKDFEGVTLPSMARIYALEINVTSGSASATNGTQVLTLPCKIWNTSGITGGMLTADLVITATSAGTNLTITALGKSS
jgi:hypothetical protein